MSGARTIVSRAALAALLAGPAVLAFFAGGYFDLPREWAGLVAWVLVVVALLAWPPHSGCSPIPARLGGRLAILGLALFGAWTLVSSTWAPEAGPAYHAGELVFVYVGVLLAAVALLQSRQSIRAVEPILALGTLAVIGYGISERLLPGLLQFARSLSAQGRLEQPLTYWNAMGEVAALGFVLCARLAGDEDRPRAMRVAAAAANAPFGMGLYMTFSRAALFACGAGVVTLLVSSPTRQQLRALTLAICAGVLASLAAAPFKGVTSLAGSGATRERQGAIVLSLLVLIAAVAALTQLRLARAGRAGDLPMPPRAGLIATALICAGLALSIVVGAKEKGGRPLSAGATRLTTLQSNRYAYWRVAARAFADEPLRGAGAGGWAVYWLRYRPFDEFAQDAHSLPLQTAAELGLIGLVLLGMFLAGVGAAALEADRVAPALAAGPIAGLVTYAVHAPLDWDWQMPAVTIIAIVLAGTLIAVAEPAVKAPRQSAEPLA